MLTGADAWKKSTLPFHRVCHLPRIGRNSCIEECKKDTDNEENNRICNSCEIRRPGCQPLYGFVLRKKCSNSAWNKHNRLCKDNRHYPCSIHTNRKILGRTPINSSSDNPFRILNRNLSCALSLQYTRGDHQSQSSEFDNNDNGVTCCCNFIHKAGWQHCNNTDHNQ